VYYTTLDIMTAQRHDPEAYAQGDNYVTYDVPLRWFAYKGGRLSYLWLFCANALWAWPNASALAATPTVL
jgi:hypothetical protein